MPSRTWAGRTWAARTWNARSWNGTAAAPAPPEPEPTPIATVSPFGEWMPIRSYERKRRPVQIPVPVENAVLRPDPLHLVFAMIAGRMRGTAKLSPPAMGTAQAMGAGRMSGSARIRPPAPLAIGMMQRRAKFKRLRYVQQALIRLGVDPDCEAMASFERSAEHLPSGEMEQELVC